MSRFRKRVQIKIFMRRASRTLYYRREMFKMMRGSKGSRL